MDIQNHRKFKRFNCEKPICIKMSIIRVNNNTVKTGLGNICVEDMSVGGLKFLSELILPISHDIVIQFTLDIEKELTLFYGYVVRQEEVEDGIYRYGVEFIEDPKKSEEYLQRISELSRSEKVNNSIFCTRDRVKCLKRRQSRNKRIYKRYSPGKLFEAKMKVISINSIFVESKWEDILVSDISQQGMLFASDVMFQSTRDIILEFNLIISNRELSVKGEVLRIEHKNDKRYNYAVKFILDDEENKIMQDILENQFEFSNETKSYVRKYSRIKINQTKVDKKIFERWV